MGKFTFTVDDLRRNDDGINCARILGEHTNVVDVAHRDDKEPLIIELRKGL